MLVGISASQGQGKSTLIDAVATDEYDISKIDIQTSRIVLQEWGYSLTEINSYMPLKIKFQEELFTRHCDELKPFTTGPAISLVERTFSDIFVYALVSVGPFNEYSNWLLDYFDACAQAQRDIFVSTVYLTGREYIPEDDGVRSTNSLFSNMVSSLIEEYTDIFGEGIPDFVNYITDPDLDNRVVDLIEITNSIRYT